MCIYYSFCVRTHVFPIVTDTNKIMVIHVAQIMDILLFNNSAASTATFPATAHTSSKCHNSYQNEIRENHQSTHRADMG